MRTTIRISKDLYRALREMKTYNRDSFEEVIWDLVEDRLELSEETKKNIAQSEKEIKEGKIFNFDEIKNNLEIN